MVDVAQSPPEADPPMAGVEHNKTFIQKIKIMVDVAQSVEHWSVAPVVAGSSPVIHPIFLIKHKTQSSKIKIN